MLSGHQRAAPRLANLPSNLPRLLRERGVGHSRLRNAWRLIDQSTDVQDAATFADLYHRSAFVARKLRSLGVAPRDRVVLLMDSRLAFYYALFGAMLVGAIPVAVYPPLGANNLVPALEHLRRVVRELEAAAVVTTRELYPVARLLRDVRPQLKLLVVENVGEDDAEGLFDPDGASEDAPILLQYTSGSVSSPRAVALSTRAIFSNLVAIGDAFDIQDEDVGLSWLPLYHDMGLHSVFFGLMFEMPAILMSPIAFMKRPSSWLRAISRYGVTISPAPTFGYSYAARRIQDADLEGVRLDKWRIAMCGAEPIDARVLDNFARRFARFGFERAAIMAAYGLAENVVAVSFAEVGRGLRADAVAGGAAGAFVSVGKPVVGQDIRIVDRGVEQADGALGEIEVRGPSRMIGYWRDREATQAAVSGEWLRTGDLGFVHNDELYVAGRWKELIIRAGRNIYPHDIEAAATVDGVRRGSVAAFAIRNADSATDDVVVVAEVRPSTPLDNPDLIRRIREEVRRGLNLSLRDVALVRSGSVPKTSSGKLRREACKRLYLDGKLDAQRRTPFSVLARLALFKLLSATFGRAIG
jgi:acyl-CoA synthetase (AMP-forming)/AMP-acid ligase II